MYYLFYFSKNVFIHLILKYNKNMGMIQNCRCIVNNLSNLKKLDLNLEKLFNKRIKIEEKKEDEISENFNSEEINDYNFINVISINDSSFIKEKKI